MRVRERGTRKIWWCEPECIKKSANLTLNSYLTPVFVTGRSL